MSTWVQASSHCQVAQSHVLACSHVPACGVAGGARRGLPGAWGAQGGGAWGRSPCASVAALAASTMPLAGSLLLRAAALDGANGAGFDVDGCMSQ